MTDQSYEMEVSVPAPIPNNEFSRLVKLAELDVDFQVFNEQFADLTRLAAHIAGTEISLINLIDSYTQWNISRYGIDLEQLPRDQSVCQYTIAGRGNMEVNDLSKDDRFKNQVYVNGGLQLRYYLGVPLQTTDGHNVGTLCLYDRNSGKLTPEKIELLQIVAKQIVEKLEAQQHIELLNRQYNETRQARLKAAHDIRGPISGIMGLANYIEEMGHDSNLEEVLRYMKLINKSGQSLLDLTDEILKDRDTSAGAADKDQLCYLPMFKQKLLKLYLPQAMQKDINFVVETNALQDKVPIIKTKLLQIAGNLVNNAIKFTHNKGRVLVKLKIEERKTSNAVCIEVHDNGEGMTDETIENLFQNNIHSTIGTAGEGGYGYGISLVNYLVRSLNGTLHIQSEPGKGSCFKVHVPQPKL